MPRVTIQKELAIDVSIHELAKAFSEFDDDAQARFFCAVAAEFSKFDGGTGAGQTVAIAGHLNTCSCSTKAGRQWIRDLAELVGGEP
jgi:hypothetical protein